MHSLIALCRLILLFMGCSREQTDSAVSILGGEDAVTINLPFAAYYQSRCTQGVAGSYSHHYGCTYYDLDLDTPNDRDDPVYAPVGGRAYVHDSDPNHNFGNHVNIDLGDGTYIILGHMKDIFVNNMDEVAPGQLLGFEGATGAAAGDHIHIGRHRGAAAYDGIYGTSIEGLQFSMKDDSNGRVEDDFFVDDVTCDLSWGHIYESELPINEWHPSGTLVKTPSSSTVYLVEGTKVAPFLNADMFYERHYSFDQVVSISQQELACYSLDSAISSIYPAYGVYDGTGTRWLLLGVQDDPDAIKYELPATGWQNVLLSYGVSAASDYDLALASDGYLASYPAGGMAKYRDGTLISPKEASDVYVMEEGYAMPIDSWDTYLLMGFEHRTVLEIPQSEIEAVVTGQGSCTTNVHCIRQTNTTVCGGGHALEESVQAGSTGAEDGDEVGDSGNPVVDQEALLLTWSVPNGATASLLSLSGEYVDVDGVSAGWVSNLESAANVKSVSHTFTDAKSGDSFRFSVEYTVNGVTSWSCLAPYPPGTVQGTSTATLNGSAVSVNAVADPSSSGCGLQVTVP